MKYFLALAFFASSSFANAYTLYEMTFDQKALQKKIDTKFPFTKIIYTKKTHLNVGTVVLTEPKIILSKDSERIGIEVRFEFTPAKLLGHQVRAFTGKQLSSAK